MQVIELKSPKNGDTENNVQVNLLSYRRFFGRRELRDVFIGAAETAMRTDSSLRDHYDALRAKGAKHKEAKLSLARKISSISLCLLKNCDTYNDNYDEYLTERKKLRKSFFNE